MKDAMVEKAYFTQVFSESSFNSRFTAEHARPFVEAPEVAASDWRREHLLACRVICRPKREILLPVLLKHQFPQRQPPDQIAAFIDGPDDEHTFSSEHRLIREYGVSLGQAFSALSHFRESPDVSQELHLGPEGRSKRLRRHTILEDYTDSSTLQVASSSPLENEDSQGASSAGYVDSTSHSRRAPPEDDTRRLASCVIRHVLYYSPPQDSDQLPLVVEYRDSEQRLEASTPYLLRRIVATDDGGLYLRQEGASASMILNHRVAMLEAKKRFQCIEDGRPIISDNCLAQMTCEALALRLTDHVEGMEENIVIIQATQCYMCFLQFTISDQYLRDFELDTPTSYIFVHATPLFDLRSRRGRQNVESNLRSLMVWARSV
ncbi:hypothetical protein BGZ61DRAFT_469240 [Ilyonectria robusta]|uniref:uncharacterized protein n=1 Tax=Ilyonectria robusta TaxID=1079257 RepID=UPI001E8E7CBE|nr:uncharacterized protein BGZ61DRAFT_469240 [Ilyonectria robusta]KAH8650721.1 hypothetical protein BGZ61DRAFT_469240 [Ilyonectria robusta]